MFKTFFLSVAFFISAIFGYCQSDFKESPYPLHVIFDTDFGPDYDDVGAITLLHCFADSGWVNILATMGSSKYENAAAAINVFNTYFGRPDIPIGLVNANAVKLEDQQHWSDSVIKRYPHKIENNSEVLDALTLYRKTLSSQPDQSVTIITVGFLTNLANLLNSKGDSFSALSGVDLVKRKVRNLVCMAGRFPSGREFNLDQDVPSSAKVLSEWPTSILFSGFEIGQKIKTGIPLIKNEKIQHSPVKDVFSICIPMAPEDSAGRMSWDETAVLVAIKGWQNYYTLEKGSCTINPDGFNQWENKGTSRAYLVEEQSPAVVNEIINQLIMHQPVKQKK
jgi:pyrimidine-specific ribonucleoside hydrolase